MGEFPIVSVLMTSFNREKYIGTAIESVLASSLDNFELIIVDDGSIDNTVEIARNYALSDQRVKVFINEKNLGDYPNRNKASEYASGKYIKYVDADDYIYPWGLKLLVDIMEQFPEAGWGLCSLIQVSDRPYPFVLNPKEAYELNYLGTGLFHKAPLSAIIRRDAFEKSGKFAPGRMVGDFELWNRMAQEFPVVLMPDGIVWYREHSEQESNSLRDYILTYEALKLKYLLDPKCPLDPIQVKNAIDRRKKTLKRSLLSNVLKFKISSALDNYKVLRFINNN